MSNQPLRTTNTMPPSEWPEHSLVRLRSATADDHTVYPRGALGTIVHIHRNGVAFEVEFSDPSPGVLTLEPSELEPE